VLAGPFRSSFGDAIGAMHKTFSDKLNASLKNWNLKKWSTQLWTSAKNCGAGQLFSNRTCLTCLSRTPIHILPCEHSLCDGCVDDLSRSRESQHVLEEVQVIRRCPLGCDWVDCDEWVVRRKPSEAGVRILALDGFALSTLLVISSC
jgi:hypothetical protein